MYINYIDLAFYWCQELQEWFLLILSLWKVVVARGMEGELVCRLNLWRKAVYIYTGFRGLSRDAT
jgi:hypothetical protein